MEISTAGVTVSVAEPLIAPAEAEIVVAPGAIPVASPLAVIVAVAIADDAQRTDPVRSCVLLLL
jgi:hypothetical protein